MMSRLAEPNLGVRQANYWPFVSWLVVFYLAWLLLVVTGNYWQTIGEHWGIAVAMLFGSYVAGSTPMGGGTVGFPVLVLLFDMPGSLGRNFGLSIQSIGMVSASIYIFCSRRPIERTLLRSALLGSLLGTPLGAAFIAPFVSDLAVKLLFAVVWASFGLMHLAKMRELVENNALHSPWEHWDRSIGLAIGILGGVVASITGVGIDMIVYAVLVLLYRADLKIAIPTSVVLMAWTSLVGIGSNVLLSHFAPNHYRVDPEVFYSWLAAAPVVALGAPLGSLVVNLLPRTPTLVIVSVLCIGQYFWTALHEQLSVGVFALSLIGIAVTNVIFMLLYRFGRDSRRASEGR